MTTLLILTTFSILLSAWFLFKKPKTKSIEKVLMVIHFTTLSLLVVTVVLLFQRLRFAGQYTNSLIAVTFLISGILLFGVTTSKVIKVYCGLIAIPTLLTEISLMFGATPFLLPALVAYLMFAPPRQKEKINGNYNLTVHEGGLMAPPNLFYLSKRQGLFDREVALSKSNEYYKPVSGLEVISFTEGKYIVCKIYGGNENAFTIDTLQYEK